MALSTQPYKGARDFYPEEKRRQDYMFNTMRTVVKRYGYAEYDAPILEPLDLYRAKTGEEIVNEETYNFVDRGGREVTLRPEMTPTVSRMIAAKRQELAYPVRWFSIPNLWRYERPQRGRLREHWQLNVDIFGEPGLAADHEAIMITDAILKEFGASPDMFEIKINSRELMNELLNNYLGLDDAATHALSKLIDKMKKMDQAKVVSEIERIVDGACKTQTVLDLLATTTLDTLPEQAQSIPAVAQIKELLNLLHEDGATNAVFDITLMRGFDYYTGIVFEVFDVNPDNNRSMFGGGRYDGLVALFGVDPVPTSGFGMGDVTLANFLESHNLFPEIQNETHILIATIGEDTYAGASRLASQLRCNGLNVSIDATQRKIDKKIKNADKQAITYVLFVGQDELQAQEYPLKNIVTGTSITVNSQQVVEHILANNT